MTETASKSTSTSMDEESYEYSQRITTITKPVTVYQRDEKTTYIQPATPRRRLSYHDDDDDDGDDGNYGGSYGRTVHSETVVVTKPKQQQRGTLQSLMAQLPDRYQGAHNTGPGSV